MFPPNLPLGEKQLKSIAEAQGRVNIWEGAIRSGKTIGSLFAWLMFVNSAPKGGALVMVGRTRDSLSRNVMDPLQDPEKFGFLSKHVKYNHNAPTANILGRTVYVMGANDATAEAKLRGLTVAGVYVDELTVLPMAFFTQLLGRMSVVGSRLFATTNPDGPAHWLKKRYLDRIKKLDGWRTWHFDMADNPSLTAEFIAQVSSEYTGLWYRRFIKGEWVAAEGAVYDMWDPDVHVIKWVDLPPMDQVLSVGIDYGTTNATAALMLGLGIDNKLYLMDEWRFDPEHEKARKTDAQLSAGIVNWINKTPHEPRISAQSPQWVAVDPAAASLKIQLHEDGLNNLVNADNDVAYGIRLVASGLSGGWLKVTDRCEGFITEASGYSWDPKATEAGKDQPKKVADHSLDGGRYAMSTTESIWRPHLRRHDVTYT